MATATSMVETFPSLEELREWLDAGNDPNACHPEHGWMLENAVVWDDRLPQARLLLERGADPNQPLRVFRGSWHDITVFQFACSDGAPTHVSLLLEFGAKLEDSLLFEAICHIIEHFAVETLEVLISAGADVNVRLFGCPLETACKRGRLECARALLSAGANPNARSQAMDGTSLHIAAEDENPALVALLFDAGADINALDREGNTPLIRACKAYEEGASTDTIRALLAAGASLVVRNKKGEQAVDYARTPEMVELLTRRPKAAEAGAGAG